MSLRNLIYNLFFRPPWREIDENDWATGDTHKLSVRAHFEPNEELLRKLEKRKQELIERGKWIGLRDGKENCL